MELQTLLSCEPLEALNDALCRQEEGRDFYMKAAQRTENADGESMFTSLAHQAKTQIELLERQIAYLTKENTWAIPECALACEFDPDDQSLPLDTATLEREIKPDTSDLDAIIFALKTENASYERFVRLAKANPNEQARAFYTYLAEQTSKRLELLLMNYERANQGWL